MKGPEKLSDGALAGNLSDSVSSTSHVWQEALHIRQRRTQCALFCMDRQYNISLGRTQQPLHFANTQLYILARARGLSDLLSLLVERLRPHETPLNFSTALQTLCRHHAWCYALIGTHARELFRLPNNPWSFVVIVVAPRSSCTCFVVPVVQLLSTDTVKPRLWRSLARFTQILSGWCSKWCRKCTIG